MDDTKEDATSYEKFTSRQYGFSFDYPSGWRKEVIRGQIVIYPADVKVLRVFDKDERVCSVGITMLLGERHRDIEDSPAQFFQKAILTERNSFQDYNLLWAEDSSLPSGEEALLRSFDFMKGEHPFRTIAITAIKGRRIFNLDGSCLRSDFELFEKTIRRVVMSLRLE